jgi:DNA polymerase-3 subunit beta
MNKIIVTSDALKKSLKRLGNAIHPKPTIAILDSILIQTKVNSMRMIATDLEISIYENCECQCDAEFSFLIPFGFLSKVVGLSKGMPLEIEVGEKAIKLAAGSDTYEIKGIVSVETFPTLQPIATENGCEIDAAFIYYLKAAQTTINTGGDVNNKVTKVLIEVKKSATTIASTDGLYCVFSYKVENALENESNLLLPDKAIKALDGLDKVNIGWDDKTFSFQSENTTIVVTRPTYSFVDFRKIFPLDWPSNLIVDREILIAALEKCCINSDPYKLTTLDLSKPKSVVMVSKDKDYNINIQANLNTTYSGSVKKVSFNAEKMLKLMHQIKMPTVELAINDETRPIVFRSPEDKNYEALLMTIKN